jgi:hypothetical protein
MSESCRIAPSRRPRRLALALALVPCFAASNAHAETPSMPAAAPAPADTKSSSGRALTEWGDVHVAVTERFGQLMTTALRTNPDGSVHGDGGFVRGAGLEISTINPVGWGGYYRWTTFTQANVATDAFEVRELGLGVLRRLHATGSSGSFVRTFSTFGAGITWNWIDVNAQCTSSYAPFNARCNSANVYPPRLYTSGDSLGLELRAQLGVSISWVTIAAEVGLSGWWNLTTTDGEVTPPLWALTPTAAITVGLALPYNDAAPVAAK